MLSVLIGVDPLRYRLKYCGCLALVGVHDHRRPGIDLAGVQKITHRLDQIPIPLQRRLGPFTCLSTAIGGARSAESTSTPGQHNVRPRELPSWRQKANTGEVPQGLPTDTGLRCHPVLRPRLPERHHIDHQVCLTFESDLAPVNNCAGNAWRPHAKRRSRSGVDEPRPSQSRGHLTAASAPRSNTPHSTRHR
ncbi:hypothetical protein OV450_7687 [Actinobacteria bacterium OV450]|nr:hypothetical protein OV450_7687 [Actinobacteria bacterium OV450]